jgi:bifunctional non-homologous end joining protein LigD
VARKKALRTVVGDGPLIRYSDHVEGNGPSFFAQACKLGLEGIISKRADSAYQAVRGRSWQKVKCSLRQEFIGATRTARGGLRRAAARYLRRQDLAGQGRNRVQ